jgi:hypothetical protein
MGGVVSHEDIKQQGTGAMRLDVGRSNPTLDTMKKKSVPVVHVNKSSFCMCVCNLGLFMCATACVHHKEAQWTAKLPCSNTAFLHDGSTASLPPIVGG